MKYKHIKTQESYNQLLLSGMFFEFHPELTGNWNVDKEIINNEETSTITSNPNNTNTVSVAGIQFTAQSLDGEQIEMSFSDIGIKFSDDDVFYCSNKNGEPVACLLSSLAVVLP